MIMIKVIVGACVGAIVLRSFGGSETVGFIIGGIAGGLLGYYFSIIVAAVGVIGFLVRILQLDLILAVLVGIPLAAVAIFVIRGERKTPEDLVEMSCSTCKHYGKCAFAEGYDIYTNANAAANCGRYEPMR